MTKRPTSGKRFSGGGANLRPIRLVLEPLEARRLLAGMDLSSGLGATTFLTLDYSSVSTVAPPLPLGSLIEPQFQAGSPQGLQAEGEPAKNSFQIFEDAPQGTLLGSIAFDDFLSGQPYTLQSADPRFTVANNELYFSHGQLDFETEPTISLAINAVNDNFEVIASTGVVVSIIDVNERPLAIELNGGQVNEHEPGANIGALHVVDPDIDSQGTYAFFLFDARFTLSGNQLRLADGVELDYATEPEVMLAIAATDGTFEIFDTVRIEVVQQPETPVAASSIALDPRQIVELTAGAPVGRASMVDPRDGSYEFSVSDSRFEFVGDQLKLRDDRQVNAALDPEISLEVTAVGDQGDQASGTFSITVISARSPYHNYNLNKDVNGDGFISPIDALLVINELNRRGAGPVVNTGGTSGEGPIPMLDVNGDGMVTPLDVLLIINHLNHNRAVQNRIVPNGPVPNSLPKQSVATDPPTNVLDDANESNVEASLDFVLEAGWQAGNPATANLKAADLEQAVDEFALAAAQFFYSDSQHSLLDADSGAGLDVANFTGQLSERSADRRKLENASIDAELELLLSQLSASHQAAL